MRPKKLSETGLVPSAINEYWSGYPEIFELMNKMTEVESWTIEDEFELDEMVSSWAKSLNADNVQVIEQHPASFILLLFFLKTPSAIYLYERVVELYPPLEKTLQINATALLNDEKYGAYALVFWDRFKQILVKEGLSFMLSNSRIEEIKGCIQFVNETMGGLESD